MFRRSFKSLVGVSAMSVFLPPARIDLKNWCDWTGNSFEKVSAAVGHSFRVISSNENVYTMTATAALRLILQNNIDPGRVGMLALGTESSTDNAAGAVIVRGMVDMALAQLGMPRLSRHCEVHESKHACLGGIYALKNACRYALTDGADRLSIVVSGDIAEYQRGSTGEQTQGAGAVAMLVERRPKMFELDIAKSGSSSQYRGPDFRKPTRRHWVAGYDSVQNDKISDFPVFSGGYSTVCYEEAVTVAVEDMLRKIYSSPGDFYEKVSAVLMHRPYKNMPIQAMSFLYARALARAHSPEHKGKFSELCAAAKVSPVDVISELDVEADFFESIEKGITPDINKNTSNIAKLLRRDKSFMKLLDDKMSLGSPAMMHFGNLYAGSLPAWIAAAFEEAQQTNRHIDGHPMVIVGYGSGDASEAIPLTPVAGWQKPAANIGVGKALEGAVDLTKVQYEGYHSGAIKEDIAGAGSRKMQFLIDRIGQRHEKAFQDLGIEYYRFLQ